MKNLAAAVIAVMKEVKGMEKNSRVGTGRSAYDGTKDQDVKEVFNKALADHGLCMLPIGIEETTQIDRWEEPDMYNGGVMKMKQSIFTKVTTKYLLLHDSGESQVIVGYGHGIDPADKGAGKATTYAMKNALLYSFVTPVGKIDDADNTHSNEIKTPQAPARTAAPAPAKKEKKEATKELAEKLIRKSKTPEELKTNWSKVKTFQKEENVLKAKEEMKNLLSKQNEAA